MKDNKTQQRKAIATGFREIPAKETARQKNSARTSPGTAAQSAYEEPIVRRYAIDDHGGGYQGL